MSNKKSKISGHKKKLQSNAQLSQLQQLYLQAQHLQQQGYLNEAERLYAEILKLRPDQPDSLHYLGLIFMQKGDFSQAASFMLQSIKYSSNPVYYSNYGMLLARQGKHEQATEQYQKAVNVKSGYAEAWFNLGVSLGHLGRLEEAEHAYLQAISNRKEYIKALYNLACIQESMGKPDDANKTIEKILAITPGTADVYYKLAQALQFLGGSRNIHKAYEYFKKALEIDPASLEIKIAYAKLLAESNNIEIALDEYRSILRQEPDYQEARIDYALNLIKDGQAKPAEKELSKILEQTPENIAALTGIGGVYRINGNFSEAEIIYNKILSLDEFNDFALYGIANSRKYTDENDEIITRLNHALDKKETSIACYALGKIYDDLNEYDQAFSAYKKANDIKNRKIDYSHLNHTAYVDNIIKYSTGDVIERMQNYGNSSETPVFIVGTPRSGTTLTEQIISSHPFASGAGELKYIGQLARNKLQQQTSDFQYPERIKNLTENDIRIESGIYLDRLNEFREHDEILRITDKMPGNFFYIGYILMLFPKARIIHCKRNPLDACLSMYFQAFQASHQYSFDLENLGYWYKDYIRLRDHWNNIVGNKILTVEYDDTVNNTEQTARKLIDFCGLQWDDRCLEFHKQEREVKTASQWQVRQPVYKTSLERWKRYDKHIGPLKEILAGYY